ncbi:MAG: hypothetical protein QXT77_05315 [Candidatus Methanomethylicaceae archaeon]
MPDFVLYNVGGCLLPWAMTLSQEGYSVVLVNPKKGEVSRSTGEGIVEISESLPDDPEAVYVFDANIGDADKLAEELKKAGRKVLGGGEMNWKLERDRRFAAEVASSWGINIPPTTETTAKEAYKIASETEETLVWKPERDAEAHYTFVSPNREDVILFLQWLSKEHPDTPGILQPYIEGIAVSFDFWWNGKEALQWWLLVEDKKFPARGLGENTGCEISILRPIIGGEPAFLDVRKMESWLRDNNIAPGVFGFTVMVDNQADVHFLEMDPRFGWDVDVTRIPIVKSSQKFGEYLKALAEGGAPKEPKDLVAASVRLSVSPYPHVPKKGDEGAKGVPVFVRGENIYLYSVRSTGQEGMYELTDEMGLVGVAVGVGDSATSSYRSLKEALDNVFAPGLRYRADMEEAFKDFVEVTKLV